MNKEKKIIISFGTRPEIIKLAPIIHILKKRKYDFKLVHSGQHYSKNMNDVFLKNEIHYFVLKHKVFFNIDNLIILSISSIIIFFSLFI